MVIASTARTIGGNVIAMVERKSRHQSKCPGGGLLIQTGLQRRLAERAEHAQRIKQFHQQRESPRFRTWQDAQYQRRRRQRANCHQRRSRHRAGREQVLRRRCACFSDFTEGSLPATLVTDEAKVDIEPLFQFFRGFRRRRMQLFFERFNVRPETRVLDIGGREFNWTLAPVRAARDDSECRCARLTERPIRMGDGRRA